METYALKLCEGLAPRCSLLTRVLPGRAHGVPPTLFRLTIFLIGSIGFLFRRRADVVHVGDLVLWPLALAARWFRSAPRVAITAYGLDVIYGQRKGLLPRIYATYLALGVRLIGQRVRIIAISQETARLCRDAGFADVVVVTLGVDLPTSAPPPDEAPGPFILFVGRLVRRKGAAWFIREVLPLLPDAMGLLVVGKDWDPDEVAALRESSRVDYREVVSSAELFALRRSATVVVMPNIPSGGTDVEGFGLTAVEAGADGGVLLASGIEGIVDAVIDGTTGFLLPAGDASAWVGKILEVAAWELTRRARFIASCQAAIGDHYAWPVVAERTLAAYESTRAVA
ncbi:glycosyltransferase family 4 protein [Luteibacter aegosomaticola]|uniref:glycosyltransferase family 4 protein n=1 Tax=Luteibacter aegosomaticola TaxID=2911538 RepID=UPI001FF7E17D|nr:glycosyltransferase family 4 protein [Luteibacter aegosomaticola]UPG91120.1 glycosyltransferase family 4 protein [Luteibacter aegosomaticola]